MKPEIKEKWLTALRSGQYKQGKGFLRVKRPEGERYCCLGVLCDIAVPQNWRAGLDDKEFRWYGIPSKDGIPYYTSLPSSVRDLVNITYDQQEILAIKNDDGMTFERIAEYIEKNL